MQKVCPIGSTFRAERWVQQVRLSVFSTFRVSNRCDFPCGSSCYFPYFGLSVSWAEEAAATFRIFDFPCKKVHGKLCRTGATFRVLGRGSSCHFPYFRLSVRKGGKHLPLSVFFNFPYISEKLVCRKRAKIKQQISYQTDHQNQHDTNKSKTQQEQQQQQTKENNKQQHYNKSRNKSRTRRRTTQQLQQHNRNTTRQNTTRTTKTKNKAVTCHTMRIPYHTIPNLSTGSGCQR